MTTDYRIFKVEYGSGVNRRRVRLWVKAPIGFMHIAADMLVRAQQKGQVRWFRSAIATPEEIALHRGQLARPIDALLASSSITRVDWSQ